MEPIIKLNKEENRDACISVGIMLFFIGLYAGYVYNQSSWDIFWAYMKFMMGFGLFLFLVTGAHVIQMKVTKKYLLKLYQWKLPIHNDFIRRFIKVAIIILTFFVIYMLGAILIFVIGAIWEAATDKDPNPNDPHNVNGFKRSYFDKDGYLRND